MKSKSNIIVENNRKKPVRKYNINDVDKDKDDDNFIDDSEDNSEDDFIDDGEDDSEYDSKDDSEDDSEDDDEDDSEYANNKNNKLINTYITNYIKTIKDKYNVKEDIYNLKKQATQFYNNLVITKQQLHITQLYENIKYFIDDTPEQRISILETFTNIINLTDTKMPKIFKIMKSSLDTYYKKVALNKLKLLDKMKPEDSEYFKLSNWLDTFLEIPFNIYKIPKYMDENIINNPALYLTEAQQHLDKVIYGQQETKSHIIEILAKMITNPKTMGSVFAIHGDAGTGKTTLIKDGLSEVFGLPFIFISLGGAQDRTFLSGSNYVYEGSTCGKIIQSLKQSQCMNPIFYFDELDKVSNTDRGQEIINMLIHLTDYTQNTQFMDDYMDGIVIDLSRATFIFSFNDKQKISPILLDRMEIIKFQSYTITEKKHIATTFLLPSIIKNIFGDTQKKIVLTNMQIDQIVKIPCMYNYNSNNNKAMTTNTKNGSGISKIHNVINKNNLINKKRKYSYKTNSNKYGGVRYIKKRLERLVSKMNVEIITGNIKNNNNNNNFTIDDNLIKTII